MYEQVTFIGNLGQDPDMRYTPNGNAVCNFSIAVNRRWTQDGEAKEATKWVRVSVWNKLAEVCNQYLGKGRQVLVIGRLADEIRIWQDQSGEHRASYELTAHEVKFLGGRGNGNSQRDEENESFAGGNLTEEENESFAGGNLTEEEIPF